MEPIGKKKLGQKNVLMEIFHGVKMIQLLNGPICPEMQKNTMNGNPPLPKPPRSGSGKKISIKKTIFFMPSLCLQYRGGGGSINVLRLV